MTAADALFGRLRASGVSVLLRLDGKLWLEPKTALTPELLAAAKAHRDALTTLLTPRPVQKNYEGAREGSESAGQNGQDGENEENGIVGPASCRADPLDAAFSFFSTSPDGPVENAAIPPADPEPDLATVSARAAEMLAAAENRPGTRITDLAKATDYFRGRAIAELTPEVPDATIHRLRQPSWADPHDTPRPNDRCRGCGGNTWWCERNGPLGWLPTLPSVAAPVCVHGADMTAVPS